MANTTCEVDGCERTVWARGYCNPHYLRWHKTGDPGSAEIRRRGGSDAKCEYPGCKRRHESGGLCPGHRNQKMTGRELAPLQSRLKSTDRDEHGRKLCRLCREWLPVDSFFKNRTPKDGLHNRCMRCHRSEALRRRYGITLDDYLRALAGQGGVCKICGGVNESGKELAVDHDHACCPGRTSCGQCIRGLLCSACNAGIGMLGEDAARLIAAAAYLQQYGDRSGSGGSRQV